MDHNRIKGIRTILELIIISFILSSCNTEKSRLNECEKVVQTFVANLPVDNYQELFKYYPTMKRVKRYWKFDSIHIRNSSISEDGIVNVIGESAQKNLLFVLKKINGHYIITDTKGLSSLYNSNLYKYCKNIGCIGLNEYDGDLSEICSGKEDEFAQLKERIKGNIEASFVQVNNNLTSSFGLLNGEVTMKNTSIFTIPAFDYEISYLFYDSENNLIFSKNETMNFKSIGYGESLTRSLFESNSNNFRRLKVILKLTSTDFIEDVICENVKGKNCISNMKL